MMLNRLPLKLQKKIIQNLSSNLSANTITVEEEMKLFAEELKEFFTKEELEKIARKVKYVQRSKRTIQPVC